LIGGWMLLRQPSARLWLDALVAGSTVTGALIMGMVFVLRPPNRRTRVLSG
jgi:hypothetical protein